MYDLYSTIVHHKNDTFICPFVIVASIGKRRYKRVPGNTTPCHITSNAKDVYYALTCSVKSIVTVEKITNT